MSSPAQIDVTELIAQANRYASNGDIDSTANLLNSRVYVFAGTLDSTVDPGQLVQIDSRPIHESKNRLLSDKTFAF